MKVMKNRQEINSSEKTEEEDNQIEELYSLRARNVNTKTSEI